MSLSRCWAAKPLSIATSPPDLQSLVNSIMTKTRWNKCDTEKFSIQLLKPKEEVAFANETRGTVTNEFKYPNQALPSPMMEVTEAVQMLVWSFSVCVSHLAVSGSFATRWTIDCQTLSLKFSRQEYWISQPFPSPGDPFSSLPIQKLNPGLLHCRQIPYCLSHQGSSKVRNTLINYIQCDT